MLRGQRFRLYPTRSQEEYLAKACGVARFAYNWALALRKRYYAMFGKTVSAARLQKLWNRTKERKRPWVSEVTKHAPEQAFRSLDEAYKRFFTTKKGFPKFKRKGVRDSFCAGRRGGSRCDLRFEGDRIVLPKIGGIRFRNDVRWPDAHLKRVHVSRQADKWFASVLFEIPDPPKLPEGRPTCGVDLGCKTFATVASQGVISEEVQSPKPYAKAKRRLKRLQRAVSRKRKGGKNRQKAVLRLARQHLRVSDVRGDFLHKLTSGLIKRYGVIVLEDLNIRGMVKNHKLAGTISDMGFGEFRRQMTYKADMAGTRLVFASRWYPSSKTCSRCEHVLDKLGLSERSWTCPACGIEHDRDHNAAINLEKLATGSGKVTPAEIGVQAKSRHKPRRSRCRSKKQECLEDYRR